MLPFHPRMMHYNAAMTTTQPLLHRLGIRVRRLRLERGLMSREAAMRAGLSPRFYSQLEGGRANIAYTRLAAVAQALEVPLARLVDDAEEDSRRPVVGLLGLRGAGKSTVGSLVAESLSVPFVELDERIEASANLSLSEIFALHGESWYRRLAAKAVRDLVEAGRPCVVALPGGIVQDAAAFRLLRERCVTAWLKARPQDHMDRVLAQGDRRPMANRANAMDELRQILAQREPYYRQADVAVDTSRRGAGQVAASVVSSLLRVGWQVQGADAAHATGKEPS